MYGATMLYVLTAILAWRPGGASARPILHASLFLTLASVQVILGIAHVPSLHVPLGVLMFALSCLALAQQVTANRDDGAREAQGAPEASSSRR
jgi:heme A synthase